MPKKTLGFCGVICALCAVSAGYGATLHYGEMALRLDTVRRTTPALAIGMGNGVQYGSLASLPAPAGALHIGDYWVAQNCAPGTYSVDGLSACTDCGLGHYCVGGTHRAACSGGIIGCPTTRATADAGADAMANRLLTLDEVTAHVPVTDLSQWKMVTCCNGSTDANVGGDLSLVNSVDGCATMSIGPGTYLFVQNAGSVCPPPYQSGFSAFMAVFNHPVSYRSMHAIDVFYNFIDIDGPEFTGWDIQVSPEPYCYEKIETNVTGLDRSRDGFILCVYELK